MYLTNGQISVPHFLQVISAKSKCYQQHNKFHIHMLCVHFISKWEDDAHSEGQSSNCWEAHYDELPDNYSIRFNSIVDINVCSELLEEINLQN